LTRIVYDRYAGMLQPGGQHRFVPESSGFVGIGYAVMRDLYCDGTPQIGVVSLPHLTEATLA